MTSPDLISPGATPARAYSRAPIVEVVFDIKVDAPGGTDLDKFYKCHKPVKADYPIVEKKQIHALRAVIGEEVGSSMSTRPLGYIFRSADKKQLFQVSQEGFTFNRLAPYTGWATFVEEARRLWEVYRKVVHPRGYKRIAIRTINKFDFPSPTVRTEDYFRTYPEVSRDLPQVVAGFFYQINLLLPEIESVAVITETTGNATSPEQSSIVLDIDLFRTENLPAGPGLWPLFETLRVWKNKVFEACITDAARELIQ